MTLSEPTKAGHMLLMAGLTFRSGRRLADYPELVAAIEAEAVAAALSDLREEVEEWQQLAKDVRSHNEPEEDIYAVGLEQAIFRATEFIDKRMQKEQG